MVTAQENNMTTPATNLSVETMLESSLRDIGIPP